MEQQMHLMGPTIKPFQKAMDKLFLRDKFSRNIPPVPDHIRPYHLSQAADGDSSSADHKQVGQPIDLAFIKRMVDSEKAAKSKQENSLYSHTKTKQIRHSKPALSTSKNNLQTESKATISTALPSTSKSPIHLNKTIASGFGSSRQANEAHLNQTQISASNSFYVSKK